MIWLHFLLSGLSEFLLFSLAFLSYPPWIFFSLAFSAARRLYRHVAFPFILNFAAFSSFCFCQEGDCQDGFFQLDPVARKAFIMYARMVHESDCQEGVPRLFAVSSALFSLGVLRLPLFDQMFHLRCRCRSLHAWNRLTVRLQGGLPLISASFVFSLFFPLFSCCFNDSSSFPLLSAFSALSLFILDKLGRRKTGSGLRQVSNPWRGMCQAGALLSSATPLQFRSSFLPYESRISSW